MKLVFNYKEHIKPIFFMLSAFLLCRIGFILLMPATYSKDMYGWLEVIEILKRGANPYREASLLNYPPFWMQILYVVYKLSLITKLSATHIIQSILISAEAIVMLVSYAILVCLEKKGNLLVPFVIAFGINPVSILLNCQHGNFDVFIGLWLLLLFYFLSEFYKHNSPVSWLMACFVLGIGILTKTIPFILIPVMLIGIQKQNKFTNLFGLMLILMPITLGISIIYTLAPEGVSANVLGYRSMAGWYGISGILNLIGQIDLIDKYSAISPFIILLLMLLVTLRVRKIIELSPYQLLILLLSLLVFLPTFGPGYSPPYILWFLPLSVIYFFMVDKFRQRIMIVGYVILALTYIVEYATFNSHGAFIQFFDTSESTKLLCELWGKSKSQSLIRLPMFAFYLLFYALLLLDKNNILTHKRDKLGQGPLLPNQITN
ncbi:MAG: hypothetical protein V4561_04195 [Bacteroidota bacterium]